MNNWYILYNGQQIGPMNENALLAYNPTPNTMVWQEGMPEWQPLYMFPNLMDKLNSKNGGGVPPMYNTARTDKDKLAAGLLAIFLGCFGIQYFYLGKTTGGIICLLLTLVTCGLWSIISFIQGILMLTMTQQDFENKYVLSTSTFPIF